MRVLIYGINFWPELTSTGKYTGELVAWLQGAGAEVRVVTAPPYYPDWRVRSGYSSWWYRRDRFAGTAVWRCPLWVPRRPRGLTRIIHLLSFTASSLPIVVAQAAWRPDIVVSVAPTLFSAPAAWLAARLGGGRAWLHIQDFELDVATGLGLFRGGIVGGLAAAVERFWFRRFDRVSTISERMMERLTAKGVPHERRVLFPNWVDVDEIRPLPGVSPLRTELEIEGDRIVVLYAGNMGEKQGLDLLLDAAQRLKDNPRILFILAGAGAARERLERMSEGAPNVRWLPVQPAERLNDLLNLADIHLLPQRGDAADLVMPSKLTGMLASGRPIVATAAKGTQVQEVVETRGMVVSPGDIEAFTKAIDALAADRSLRDSLGRCGRDYAVAHLSRNAILGRFTAHLQALAAGDSGGMDVATK